MKKVVLIFPDSRAIADFVIKQQIQNAEVNSREQTVTAVLTDKQIKLAQTLYSGILQSDTMNTPQFEPD